MGDDVIYGYGGGDQLHGSLGKDVFAYCAVSDSLPGNRDHIDDFEQRENDQIDLSAIDADGNADNGDTAFTFIGERGFTGTAGELRFYSYIERPDSLHSEGYTVVQGDTDGNGQADFEIRVTDTDMAVNLSENDFVL